MIVVTGASGFIGSAMVWELNQAGINDILCVDEYESGDKWKNLLKRNFSEFISKNEIFSHLEGFEPSDIKAIIHFGACASTTEKDMDYLHFNNVVYSQNLAAYCNEYNIPFIYASSAATYGKGDEGFDDDADPFSLRPLNPYGYSKLLFDRWMLKQNFSNTWAGLKFFNVYGPQEYHKGDMSSIVYKAFEQIQTTGKLKLFTSKHPDYKDGEQMRDFVYVKDITAWTLQLLKIKNIQGIYNMGYGKARTWLDLASAIFKAMDKEVLIDWIDMPSEIASQYQYFTEANMTKLQKLDLVKSKWPIEKGVDDYIKSYLLKEDRYL